MCKIWNQFKIFSECKSLFIVESTKEDKIWNKFRTFSSFEHLETENTGEMHNFWTKTPIFKIKRAKQVRISPVIWKLGQIRIFFGKIPNSGRGEQKSLCRDEHPREILKKYDFWVISWRNMMTGCFQNGIILENWTVGSKVRPF